MGRLVGSPNDPDMISVQGPWWFGTKRIVAIIGGTGKYKHSRGTIALAEAELPFTASRSPLSQLELSVVTIWFASHYRRNAGLYRACRV
jgi:hypothetical protein